MSSRGFERLRTSLMIPFILGLHSITQKSLTYPLFASTVSGSEGILAIFPSDGTSAGSWAKIQKLRNF